MKNWLSGLSKIRNWWNEKWARIRFELGGFRGGCIVSYPSPDAQTWRWQLGRVVGFNLANNLLLIHGIGSEENELWVSPDQLRIEGWIRNF